MPSIIPNFVTCSVLLILPLYDVTGSDNRRKTSENWSIFSSLVDEKGQRGDCAKKEMFMIVLTNCSISPRIPWVAGNNLTSSVLLYFLKAMQACVEIDTNTSQPVLQATCQPMLLNIQVCHVGAPFSSLDTECFWGPHDMASFLLAKENMPQYHESNK